jgi:hypothetical protein
MIAVESLINIEDFWMKGPIEGAQQCQPLEELYYPPCDDDTSFFVLLVTAFVTYCSIAGLVVVQSKE